MDIDRKRRVGERKGMEKDAGLRDNGGPGLRDTSQIVKPTQTAREALRDRHRMMIGT